MPIRNIKNLRKNRICYTFRNDRCFFNTFNSRFKIFNLGIFTFIIFKKFFQSIICHNTKLTDCIVMTICL